MYVTIKLMNSFDYPFLLYFVYLWSLLWKGLALWRAVKAGQKNWFIALLVLNTAGIAEIIYLFGFAKNKLTIAEMKSWITTSRSTKKS